MASKAIGFLNFKFGADLKGFDRAMKKAQKSLKRFGKNIERTGKNLTTSLTLPILGLGAAALKFGSDLQETDSKFKQVFSSIQQEAEQTAQVFKDSFGLSELAAKQLLSDTGDLLVGFGFTEKAALDLSSQVNELAVDLASFTNFEGGAEGASKALTKALVGETESAKSLGIVIRQGTKEYKDRTEQIMKEQGVSILQAKAINNLEIAYSQSQKALGDFERTSGDFANQLRIVKGDLVDVAAEMGARLIPYAQAAIEKLKGLIQWFDGLSDSQKDNIVKWGLILAAVGPVLIIVGKLATGLSALIPVVKGVVAVLGFLRVAILTNPIGILVAALALAAGAFITYRLTANKAKTANDDFNDSTETAAEKIERLSKLVDNVGQDQFDIGIQETIDEIARLEAEIQGIEETLTGVDRPRDMLGLDLLYDQSEKATNSLEDFETLLIKLKKAQKESTATTITAVEIMGGQNDELKDLTTETIKYSRALDPLLANIEKYSKIMSPIEDQFKGIVFWQTQISDSQKLMKAGYMMFGDVLSSSLESALGSQEDFFKVFIANIKKAIRSLLIQLAVMTLINVLMGGGKAAFSIAAIKGNLGKIMNVQGFAEGGLVTGPTTALIGEGIGTTASNPEVVAPLDRLKQFMNGGDQNIVVTGKLVGNDIFLSNAKTGVNRLRTV